MIVKIYHENVYKCPIWEVYILSLNINYENIKCVKYTLIEIDRKHQNVNYLIVISRVWLNGIFVGEYMWVKYIYKEELLKCAFDFLR